MNLKEERELLIYSINDDYVQHEFKDEKLIELLEHIILIDDSEEVVSTDQFHIYKNNIKKKYAYDLDGCIYEIDIMKNKAVIIDSLLIIRKSRKK